MSTTTFNVPPAYNEPCPDYLPGSKERAGLEVAIREIQQNLPYEVPCVIDGKPVKTGDIGKQIHPSQHKTVLAHYHQADEATVAAAISGALKAKRAWEAVPWSQKVAIWHKIAALASGKYRYKIMAATMLGQGKNAWQAEIDAGAELPDFFRFGPAVVSKLYQSQPAVNEKDQWNRIEWRALEGFVTCISPFNFTALAGNLVGTPLLVGNVTIWKPSDYSILASYFVHQLLLEAGVPPSTVQFVPGNPELVVGRQIADRNFGGLHFTGSSEVFKKLNQDIGLNLDKYRGFPRVVGETGGKNFIIVHETADTPSTVAQVIRAAFEFAGQKCSALSRLYVSKKLWTSSFKNHLLQELSRITVGPETEWQHLVNSVIHKAAYDRIMGYIAKAQEEGAELIYGGEGDDSVGYFINPTVLETKDPKSLTMREEIFGPVLTVYPFDDVKFEDLLQTVDDTSDFALTGAIFSEDRQILALAEEKLRYSAGNFYLNDKCTAAVVGQQPFGGGRASGTNDKVASPGCFTRFLSPRVIKENFVRLEKWEYPSNVA